MQTAALVGFGSGALGSGLVLSNPQEDTANMRSPTIRNNSASAVQKILAHFCKLQGLYRDYIGIMEKNMEATILFRV